MVLVGIIDHGFDELEQILGLRIMDGWAFIRK